MTPENFCYWLQGLFEVGKPKVLTEEQVEEIRNHLALVFHKVTPDLTVSFDTTKFMEELPLIKEEIKRETRIRLNDVFCKESNLKCYGSIHEMYNDNPVVVYPDGPIASC